MANHSDSTSTLKPINAQILLPVGILGANIKPLPKTVALYLWHLSGCFHHQFHCHPGEVLSWFSIRDSRAAEKVFDALHVGGLIEVHDQRPGGRLLVELTDNIWRLNRRSAHPTLELFEPPAEFGGNPLLPRLQVPEAFLGSDSSNATQKLLGWCSLWRGDVSSKTVRIVHAELAKELGMDRSNLRKASLELIKTPFFDCVESSDSLLVCWSDRVFSEEQKSNLQWLSASDVLAAKHLLNLIYPGCEVIGAPVSPHPSESVRTSPQTGEVICAHDPPRLPPSLHEIPHGEVIGAPVPPQLPASLRKIPRAVPHNHNHDIDNMSCGRGADEAELRQRVRDRECFILSYASKIDLTETKRYMIRTWALMVETDSFRDQSERALTVSPEDCERFLDSATKLQRNGGYLFQAFRDAAQATDIGAGFWRKEAEQASRQIGMEFGRNMRDDIGGVKPSSTPRSTPATGRDQLKCGELDRTKRFKELRSAGLSQQAIEDQLRTEGYSE